MKKIFLFVFLLMNVYQSFGQINITTDTVVWRGRLSAELVHDADSNQEYCKFITYKGSTINWIQFSKPDADNKSKGSNFILTVTETENKWPDFNSDGQIVYKVAKDNTNGIVRIQKSGPVIMIHVEWRKNEVGLQYSFKIFDYEKL